jgi:hypothetical protein
MNKTKLNNEYKVANLRRIKYGLLSVLCFPIGFHLSVAISYLLDIDILFPVLFFLVLPITQITLIVLWFSNYTNQKDLEERIRHL